jgi:MinD-like ATPase involved in chromosome partitioning or flagellar assembly
MKRYAARLKTEIGNLLVENIIAENPTDAVEVAYDIINAVIENADIEINFIGDENEEE